MFNYLNNLLKWFWATQWKLIIAPVLLGIIGVTVIGPIIDWYTGPKFYNVYLIGDFSDKNLHKLQAAFEKEQKASLQLDGIDIHFISLDTKENEATKISAKLATEGHTLLVVGHLNSTASANALPSYLNADPPIPVILANETNPELLPADYRINYAPVFRLSPTDNKQAEKAADFMIERRAKNIWVVQDVVTNPLYSSYLVQEFIHQVHEKSREKQHLYEARSSMGPSKKKNGHLPEGRQVDVQEVSKVLLRTTNLEHPSVDDVQALGIDWVFFAGSSSNCLILTRQVKQMWKDKPKPNVLLSSSCASPELLPQGGEDIKESYLTHPMAADDFNKGGFETRGIQAFQLLNYFIRDADSEFAELAGKHGGVWYYLRHMASVHRVADGRNALRAFMEKAVDSEKSFYLKDQPYTFNRDGTAKETAFHVWQVKTSEGYSEVEN